MRPVYGCAHPLSGGPLRPEKWCHPCYLGASYLNCGWAWLYECWQEEQELHWCQRPIPWTIASGLTGLWPHLCTGWEMFATATYDGKATLGLCWVKP